MKKNLILPVVILSLLLAPAFGQKKKTAAAKKNTKPLPAAVNTTTTKTTEAKNTVDRLKKNPSPKQKKEPVIVFNEDFVKGEELFTLNRPEKAIEYFEKSLQSDNVDPKVYIYLGVCYYQIEQYDKSLAVCVQGLAKEDTDHKILAYNAGNSCYAMGNYMRADASYGIALKEDENYSPAVLNRANARLKLDHLTEARENYVRYLELEPETPQKERIEEIIRLLDEEIARRANEKPELINPDLFVENEKMEIADAPEKVDLELPAEEKPFVIPKELVLDEAVAPKVAEPPKEVKTPGTKISEKAPVIPENEKKVENTVHEKVEAEAVAVIPAPAAIIPELVGPDGLPPAIPPDQLRLVDPNAEKLEKDGNKGRGAGERVRIDEELRRFEEERLRLEAENRRLADEKRAAEAEKLRLEEANRRKAEEEARRKADEENERIAAEKRALEEERRNLEKAKMQAEFEAQKRALEEEMRKMEESRRAMEEEQKRAAEEEKRRAAEEEFRKAEQTRLEEEYRRKAEEDARKKAEEEVKRKAEEEARKAEEAKAAEEEAKRAEMASWPEPELSLDIKGSGNFTPDGDGHNDKVFLKPSVSYLEEKPESWTVSILDPQGNPFKKISGKGALPSQIEWDGKSDKGEVVLSKNTYVANLSVVPSSKDRERIGKSSIETSEKIRTGLLLQVIVPGHEWKMVVNSINFVPNGALESKKLTKEQRDWNSETLDEIVEQINDHPGSSIVIVEGYANNVSGSEKENREELLPLSQMRAEAIVDELVKRGVSRDLLKADGKGGSNPLASQNDRTNWYKNRRVEFRIKK